jgi:uncharacterized DUF497 family protein
MPQVFEFDQSKSASNKDKHGIDFVEAQSLWSGGKLVMVPAKALEDEPRFALIGVLQDKHWVAFYTLVAKRSD